MRGERERERESWNLKGAQLNAKLLKKDNVATKIKNWGQAFRNAITNMPTEPTEVISWFISLERLFNQLKSSG